MFCRKKACLSDYMMKLIGWMLAVVGVITITGVIIKKCRCKKSLKHLACACGDAVSETADTLSDSVESMTQKMRDKRSHDPS